MLVASIEQMALNEARAPRENAIQAFSRVLPKIRAEILKSRRDWDKHEPKMWPRASGLSDGDLTSFAVENDLVMVHISQISSIIIHPVSLKYYLCDVTLSDSGCCGTIIVLQHRRCYPCTYEQVRSGATSYGTIIFGKIRIPAVNDAQGAGFIHVR